ncbi:MAG: flippase-like domain-containing protein [Altibacter sp.]|uniref:lysylphosphatidylglycerol synthase transmembrane domain-containing protein n=1 Tax=Altibacter sp. TaxID=2024823 RepID=UPI001D73AE46|nr:lysylphosphatidylglycerol synthase transmembrane domain-containing protein [Altibacter sp.]MBZ0327624.1 flippase-like domain-containing protein [Altibacter sp.]
MVKFLKIAIPLGLGVFLIWYSYSKFSPEQLEEIKIHFQNANYGIVAMAVFFSVMSHVSRAYRWNFMLDPLGYQPKLLNNFMAVYIAYLMNIFIPKSGEVSRALVIDKYEGVPFDKAFGTIISERVVDLLFLFGFTLAALFLQFDVLYTYLSENIPASKLYYSLGGLAILAVLFFLFLKFSKSALQQKVKHFFSGLKEGVFSILKMKKKGAFILHTVFIWGLYLLSFYTATFALEETSAITMGALIITFVVGSFSFAFTNSGFGSYPFFVAGILAVFGITETVGTAFGWIVWTSNIASIVFFGALSFFMLPIYNKVIK